MRRFSASDIEGLRAQMDELVRPTQEEKKLRFEIAEQLALNSLPWGFLSAMTGRPYAEIVITRSAGVLPARHVDHTEEGLCRDAVLKALDRRVVLEITAGSIL